MEHEKRAHALLSASGAHRWLVCTPSAVLEAQFPDTTSEAAREGTLAHELAELKLRNYFQTPDFGKARFTRAVNKLKKQELWQDEMDGYTDEYLDHVKAAAMAFASAPSVRIEERVDFGRYVPDGFGTADCILIGGGVLHIIDFKYGKSPDGRVSADMNPQMALYALGAYEAYRILYPIEHVRLTIVQPRLPDGISEWDCPLDTLLEFGAYIHERAELAAKGEGEYKPGPKTCRYCRAKGRCRARAEENVRLAFLTDKKPPLLTNEEVGKYLLEGEDVARWLKDLQDHALSECLAGKEIPGWKAVEGRGSRDWTDMDRAFRTLMENGVAEAVLYERKPLTLAQVEKIVGKKSFADMVGSYITKNPGKPALVKETDPREAITNKITAAEAFKEEKRS